MISKDKIKSIHIDCRKKIKKEKGRHPLIGLTLHRQHVGMSLISMLELRGQKVIHECIDLLLNLTTQDADANEVL